MEVVASLSQGRTAVAQCGLFTHKSAPVIFEPPCTSDLVQFMSYYHFYCLNVFSSYMVLRSRRRVGGVVLLVRNVPSFIFSFTLQHE